MTMYRGSKSFGGKMKREKSLLHKAVLTFLMTGVVAWPSFSPVYAANSSDFEGHNGHIEISGAVHDIYAGIKVNDNVGANKFTKFNVAANEVANMQFTQWNSGSKGDNFHTLLNFVQDKINVNGTVNAIRNGKIGGNLYFFSSQGMLVGAGGAINAGALTVVAPVQSEFDRISSNITTTADSLLTKEGLAAIPLNPSGTIVVQGKINTTDGVNMRAGQIYVGTDADGTNFAVAGIKTGVTDFTGLVNLTDTGLTEEGLKASVTGTGDIELVADVQLKNVTDTSGTTTALAKIVVDGGSVIDSANDVTIMAKVENNASAVEFEDPDGNKKYVVNGEIMTSQPNSTMGFMKDRSNKLSAVVEIGKNAGANITAKKDVKIQALVENNFATSIWGGGDGLGFLTEIPSIVSSLISGGFDMVVGFLESNAEVDVYQGTTVYSSKGNIDIKAQAINSLNLGASVTALKILAVNGNQFGSAPSLAVNVGSSMTDAVVRVDGRVTAAAGTVDIVALGDNTIDSSAVIGAGYGGILPSNACVAIAADVAWGHNSAEVEIGNNAVITAHDDLAIRATANNSVDEKAKIKATEKNDMTFVLDVLNYDSLAKIDVAGILESETGDLNVAANDEFSSNSLEGDATGGSTSRLTKFLGHNSEDKSIAPNFVEPLMRLIAKQLPGEYFERFAKYGFSDQGASGEGTLLQQVLDKIKFGISVGVMDENNRAVVNVAKSAKLSAADAVNIHSRVYHHGIESAITGSAEVSSDRQDTAASGVAAMGGGAFLIRDVDNSADVIFEDRNDAYEDNVTGSSISVLAEAIVESHNVQNKIEAFQDLFGIRMNKTEFENQFENMNPEDLEKLWQTYDNYMKLVSAKFFVTETEGDQVVFVNGLPKVKDDYKTGDNKTNDTVYQNMKAAMKELTEKPDYKFLQDLLQGKEVTYKDRDDAERTMCLKNDKGVFSKFIDTVMGVVDALDVSNWVDFNVGAGVSHVYKGEGNNPTFTGNIVLGIDSLKNTANVLIGKNNRFNAANDIELKTNTFCETSYLDGQAPFVPFFSDIVSEMNSSYGLNLMIGIRDVEQNSMIVAAENVQLKGKNLTVEADATAKIVGVTEYVVTGASTSAVGSLALALPTFVNNSLISLDDEVKIDMTGNVNLIGRNAINEELVAGGLVSSGKASGALNVQILNQQRNNLVVVADNDGVDSLISADGTAPELVWTDEIYDNNPEKNKNKDTDEERLRKLIAINLLTDDSFKKKQGDKDVFDGEKMANLFGTANVTGTNKISAGSFYSSAFNEGEVVTAVADVALSITGGELDESDSGPGFFAKLADKLSPAGNFFMKYVAPTVGAPIYWPIVGFSKLGDFFQGNLNSWLPAKPEVPALEYPSDSEVPSVSLTGAGSVSVDTFKVRTTSVIDGVEITLTGANVTKDNATTTVYDFSNIASDTTGMVNVAGSAAAGTKGYSKEFTTQFNDAFENGGLFPVKDAQNATLVALSGAAGVGILVNDLTAQVKESEILDAKTVINEAVRDGHLATAAAAVAVSLPTTFTTRFKETKSAALAGGVSLNFGTFSTLASLKNNMVTGTDARAVDLFNLAQTKDIQVTGGIDVAVAKGTSTTVGLGGVVSYAAFSNDVTAEMKDDGKNKQRKYTKMDKVENIARTSLTQATMAVGIGLASKSGAENSDAAVSLQGAAAVNNIANNVFAVTDGVTIDAQSIQVLAYDFKGDITMPGEMTISSGNHTLQGWEQSSLDLFRNSANDATEEGKDNVKHYNEGETTDAERLNENGNLIITGALELSLAFAEGQSNSGSAGAAVGISLIDNNFVADVQNSNITLSSAVTYDTTGTSKITAYPARVLAESNTEKWGIVAGANASKNSGNVSVTLGGSILLDFINNDVLARVETSNITTDGLRLDAYNKEKYVNATGYFSLSVAGSGGSSVGVGLGIVYNKTLNNTAVRLLNTDVSAYRPETGSVIGLYADSDTDIYAFAFGAGVANYGLTGNVAVNVGQTNVEAVAEDDETDNKENVLNNVKKLTVQSNDNTDRTVIAGNVNVSGNGSLGVALSWNRVGHQLTADSDILKDFEKKDAQGNVVQTLVPSALTNSGEATQTNRAKVSGYQILTLQNAKVDVNATDRADFTTISVGASLGLPIGVGTQFSLMVEGANANSMIDKTTLAELVNNDINDDSVAVTVQADTENKSLSSADVLVFNAGSGDNRTAVGAAVVENTIGANTQANVIGTYNVQDMSVRAISDQKLDNYAFGVEVTTDYALGGSVVVNTISGDTSAVIGNKDVAQSKVNSSGNLGVYAKSQEKLTNHSGQLAASGGGSVVASGGGSVAVNSISGDTLATINNSEVAVLGGKDLTVSAGASHFLNDVTACGVVGLSQAGGSSFGVDATVAVDKIDGSTKALVVDTDINKDKESFGDVNVLTQDVLKSSSKVVNGGLNSSIAGKAGVNIGAGVLVNNNNRIVQSGIGGADEHVLNANELKVLIDSSADVNLLNLCASVVFSGTSVAAVASVTSAEVEETTDAYVKNVVGHAGNITVEAKHKDDYDFTGTNAVFAISTELVGVGVGVQVNSLNDKAITNAGIDGSTFAHSTDSICNDVVSADSISDVNILAFNAATGTGGAETYGLGGVGVGVMVVDNDLEQITLAKVNNSQLGDETDRADNVRVEADNRLSFKHGGVDATLGTGAGVGVVTLYNGINATTRADVIGSKIYADRDIQVKAFDNKDIDNKLFEVSLGVLAVGVPVIHNYIGMDVDDEYTFVATAKENIDDKDEKKANKESALNKIGTDEDQSFSATDIKTITAQGKEKFNVGNTVTTDIVPVAMAKQGVAVNVDQSVLKAGGNLNIQSQLVVNSDAIMAGGEIGAVNVMVPVNRQRFGENATVNLGNSTVVGISGVNISSSTEGKLENCTTEVSVSGANVLVTTTELTKQKGSGAGITIGGTDITATGDLNISTSDTLSLENHLTQVGVGIGVFGAIVSTTQDNSDSKITIDKGNDFSAQNITVSANSTPTVFMGNTSVSASEVHGTGMINEVSTAGNTILNVADGNAIKANTISLQAQLLTGKRKIGEDEQTKEAIYEHFNLKSDIYAVGVSILGIGVDKSRTYSDRNIIAQVGNITLSGLTEDNVTKNIHEVGIGAYDGTVIDNYIRTTTVGMVASESNFAQSRLNNNVTTTVDTGTNTWSGIDSLIAVADAEIDVQVHAKGSSGSAIGIMPYAAQVENIIEQDVTLNVKGNYEVGEIGLYALQFNDIQLCADALTVTLMGGAGTRTYNEVTLDTTANITDADITTNKGDVNIYVSGNANLNKLGEVDENGSFSNADANCLVLGNGVGGIDIEVAKGDNKITFNDTLNITNTTLTVAGNTVLGVSSGGILRAQLFDYTVNAVGGAQLRLYNTIRSNNIINLADSEITGTEADKDVTLTTCDNLEITAATYAEMTAGASGATEAKTENTVDRKNQVNLQSGAIYSRRDVNLYAGKDEVGNNGMFDLIGRAETYCGALIPVSSNPTLVNNVSQGNEINVESGVNVVSVRHANLYADHGTEHIKLLEARHSMYKDKNNVDAYVATEKGNLSESGEKYNNYVNVDGSITAGASNVVNITIGETGMFIVKDEYEKAMISGGNNNGYQVYTFEEFMNLTTDGLQIVADESSGLTKEKFLFGVDDYISNLDKRLDELNNLASDASLDKKDGDNTALYNAYKSELARVAQLRAKMEHYVVGQERQLYDAYIVVPDLVASGGNVNVDTGTFCGAGNVTAKGTPSVTINNNTNLELRVQDIVVDDPGGLFNFNNRVISGTADEIRSAVAEQNADKKKAVGMDVTVPVSSAVSDITINGNWAGSSVNYAASGYQDEKGQTVQINAGSLYAVANIEINGTVNSKQGDVRITSANNDIFIESADVEKSANVLGRNVYLSAPSGSITQGFTDGIVNVGGDVQSQFAALYNAFIATIEEETNSTINYGYSDGGAAPNGGRIAGGEIYINALDININGILQSGYENYFVDIDDRAQTKINDLKNSNQNSDLTDAMVLGNSKYCVVEGADVVHKDDSGNEMGYYDRQIAVYYNPATDTLLTENVDASGGKIYLTGRISSTGSVKNNTGNGAIYCMDGAYNISVTNSLPYDLKTNTLLVNEVSGLVQFTDIGTGIKTLVRKSGITYEDSAGNTMSSIPDDAQVFAMDGGYYFKPTAELRYSWSQGYSQTEYQEYYKEFMAKWWGLADGQEVASSTLSSWVSEATPIGNLVTGAGENRPNGETISVETGISDQVSMTHNYTEVERQNRLTDTQRWTTGYLGCHKHWAYTWRETKGVVQSNSVSVKADNDIGIKFIGSAADASKVSVSSTGTGNIILAGSMGNMEKYAVEGQDYIVEKAGIVVNAQGGSVIQEGGSIYGSAVDLTAMKDINVGSIVNGHDLTLSANVTGGGSIDITVKDRADASVSDNLSNIKIAQLGGTNGANVDTLSLHTDGNIVQLTGAPASVADRINLVSGLGNVTGENNTYFHLQGGQQVIGGDSLSASVNVTANKDIRVQQTDGDLRIGKIHSDNGDVYISVSNGGVVDALPYVERTSLEENELVDLWKGMGIIADGDSNLIAEKTEVLKKVKGQNAQYEAWDKDLLLYQLDDAIVNPRAGIKSSEKEPNVFGKNIHIDVKNGVGLNSDTVTEINMEHLDLDKIKFLSQVDPSTVTWKTNDQGESIAVITDRLALGVQQSGVGSISITTTGGEKTNVFVESRRDDTLNLANPYMNLDIAKIVAGTGNVTITSLGSIYDVNTSTNKTDQGYATVATISGKDIMLLAGEIGTNNGNIGMAGKYVRLDMSGNLTATATGNIYLEQAFADGVAKDLNIVTMTAGVQNGAYSENSGNIYLRSAGNIYGVILDSRVQGYLRSDSHGEIVLDAYGNIGYAVNADGNIDYSKTLRVKNADVQGESGKKHDSISVRSVTGSINLEGVSTAEIDNDNRQAAGGYLNIFELSGNPENVILTLNGDLNLNAATDLSQSSLTLNVNGNANLVQNITAENIVINAANSIVLADDIVLKASDVVLNTDESPVLTYGTIAKNDNDGGLVCQGNLLNYDDVADRTGFFDIDKAQIVFSSTSEIQAKKLQVNASKGTYLGGKNDCNNVVIRNAQESVVYHNVADVNAQGTEDVLTIGIFADNASEDLNSQFITGSVWVYSEEKTKTSILGEHAKPIFISTGVYALGDVAIISNGSLTNDDTILSKQGDVYLSSEFALANRGTIKAENGFVGIGANRIDNYAIVEAKKSIFLLSAEDIYNGEEPVKAEEQTNPSAEPPVNATADIHMYAGDDIVLLTAKGLTNTADLFAGVDITNGEAGHGGDVFLDDYTVIRSGIISQDTMDTLELLMGGYWEQAPVRMTNSTVLNTGTILAVRGEKGDGLVYLDSAGRTENSGTIYSLNGAVFMDSSEDLINHKNIYVVNTDNTDTASCNVTLQATGNVYNAGNIYVSGKGAVILDADGVKADFKETTETVEFNGIYNSGSISTDEGNVTLETYGYLQNNGNISSEEGYVYLSSEESLLNRGTIKAENGFVGIGANRIDNYAIVEAKRSIFLLSVEDIYNGEEPVVNAEERINPSAEPPVNATADIHMYAGDDIVLLTAKGLTNTADLLAGVDITNGEAGHGGDVFLDDYTVIRSGIISQDTMDTLELLMGDYWDHVPARMPNSTVLNTGTILAVRGEKGDGLVYLDSAGRTENSGAIYSLNGAVFMDSSEDLINHRDIYVENTIEGSSCNVTLQATGNVYNTGDIYVDGKGTVTLDADGVDQDGLDLQNMTPTQLELHKKQSTLDDTVDAEGKPITYEGVYNTGDIYASDGDVTIKSATGNVYNTDALNTVTDDDITGVSSIVYSQGSIALLAPMGHIENTKALYATKNITIECVDDLYNAPAETSAVPGEYGGHTILRGLEAGAGTDGSGDLKLISHNGVIYNDGILKATRGDVIVDAGGAKVFEDVVFVIDDKVCPVPLNGKTKFENESYSIINTKHGDVMVADGNIVIHGQSGVLTLGDMYALHQHVQDFKDPAQSQVDFMKAAENIEKYATGIAEGKGNISLVSDVGDVFVYSVNEQNEHDPNGHWFLSAQDFTLKATGGHDADGNEIGGFVYNDKGLKADFGSINMTYGMGVNVGCAIESIHKDVTIRTTRGSAVIASAIKAGSYINLEIGRSADDQDYGKDDVGTLVILDNSETGTSYLQAKDGITMQAADSIFIRDKEGITTNELLRLYAFGDEASDLGGQYSGQAGIFVEGNMTSINGDIDIGLQHGKLALSSADGSQIYDIVAHNGMTAVGTHDADITVDNLEGKQVILYTETPEVHAGFNTLTVGEKLVLAVNDLDMDMSKVVAYDEDKPFEMNIYTVGNPMDAKIRLDYSKSQVKNIEIQKMNVGQAEIVANVPVKIDELSVADRADIDTMGTGTSIYGSLNEYDAEAEVMYFSNGMGGVGIDLSSMFFGKDVKQNVVNDVANNLWKYETGATGRDGNPKANTMALDIVSAKIQSGSGILLAKDRGYIVNGQSYSVESVMQNLLSINVGNVFNTTFNNNIQFFNRFDNVAIPDVVVNRPEEWDKDQFEF